MLMMMMMIIIMMMMMTTDEDDDNDDDVDDEATTIMMMMTKATRSLVPSACITFRMSFMTFLHVFFFPPQEKNPLLRCMIAELYTSCMMYAVPFV